MENKALFTGLTTIDIQFLLDTYPKSNTKNKAKKHGVYVGGPATNAAFAFSYLGGESMVCTSVGKHPLTTIVFNEFAEYDINYIDLTPEQKQLPIISSIITTDDNGERTVFSYSPDKIMVSLAVYKQIEAENYDIVLVDGFHIESCIEVAKIARRKQIPVVFDGGSWKDKTEMLLPFVDIAICSENFFPPNCYTTEDVFNYLDKDMHITKAAISRGGKTVLGRENNTPFEIDVEQVKAVDTLGAGDFLHGAFCFYYLEKNDFKEAIIKASRLATKSCMFFGTRTWMQI